MQATRREFMTGGVALTMMAAAGHPSAASRPEITVHKSPT
jgi:hypothetical protein